MFQEEEIWSYYWDRWAELRTTQWITGLNNIHWMKKEMQGEVKTLGFTSASEFKLATEEYRTIPICIWTHKWKEYSHSFIQVVQYKK